VNTYDGAAAEIESILIRMRELAVQAKNGTYEEPDRVNANYEYTALKAEIRRIAGVSAFNRMAVGQGDDGLAGSTGTDVTSFGFYVGSDVAKGGNNITFSAEALDMTIATSGGTLNSVLTATSAGDAILNLDDAIRGLAANRAQAGALVNRLEHTVSNLMNVSQRLQEAVSGIEDADYAAESANLARGMVLAQAGTAMLAQANQAPQYILSLLRG